MKKIVFFDIDGTLTSELDASIPASTVSAIRKARTNGHLMFINTGRCFPDLELRFREIGFDGYICGCGTNIYCNNKEIFYVHQSHETIMKILTRARETDVDILFESKNGYAFDLSRPLKHPNANQLYKEFLHKKYDMTVSPDIKGFISDKFVIWFQSLEQLSAFRKISDPHFDCIDRGGHFREFVPLGYSKATGVQYILDHFHIERKDAYAFGDSNNDLAMLTYVPNSIAMGNSSPHSLFKQVSYVTAKASEDGIANALKHFHLI